MFYPFQVEQFLSENEQGVSFNFSESGVHPLSLGELLRLAGKDVSSMSDCVLNYPQVEGDRTLRQLIADMYPDTHADNVLVTVGASEANHLVAQTLLATGDEVAVMRPTYQQLPGNARNLGLQIRHIDLVEADNWALDLASLERSVCPRTRLISIVNPNNPTGYILSEDEMSAIVAAADRVGAWIVADEVYAGTERQAGRRTPTFVGRYERVIGINSMSKAYGLPGLRLGWMVAPREMIPEFWRRHEYATISATMLGNELAKIALSPEVRPKLIERARALIRTGFDTLQNELRRQQGVFSVVPPQASAMSFVRFRLPADSRTLVNRLRAEQDVLVVPGDCFGLDNHFRFSSALPEPYLREGLNRLLALTGQLLGDDRSAVFENGAQSHARV